MADQGILKPWARRCSIHLWNRIQKNPEPLHYPFKVFVCEPSKDHTEYKKNDITLLWHSITDVLQSKQKNKWPKGLNNEYQTPYTYQSERLIYSPFKVKQPHPVTIHNTCNLHHITLCLYVIFIIFMFLHVYILNEKNIYKFRNIILDTFIMYVSKQ